MSDFWPEDSAEHPPILAETRERVAVITLNRPDRLNAWTPPMGTLYFNTLDRLAADPGVNVILVRGAGRAFCAGADLKGLGNIASSGGDTPGRDARPYWHPLSIGKPVVAAIHGPCYTVGLQQALCCDIRLGSPGARFCVPYAKRGLIAELGIGWQLTRIIGLPKTMDLLLSGREVGGEEALALGLVNALHADDELFDRAFEYCRTIAAEASPWSLRTMKQQVYQGMMTDLQAAFAQSEIALGEALSGPDFVEGLDAFREKRDPQFPPLDPRLARLDIWPGE